MMRRLLLAASVGLGCVGCGSPASERAAASVPPLTSPKPSPPTTPAVTHEPAPVAATSEPVTASTSAVVAVTTRSVPSVADYVAPDDAFLITELPEGFVPRSEPSSVDQAISPAGYGLVSQTFINSEMGQLLIVSVSSGTPSERQLTPTPTGPVLEDLVPDHVVYVLDTDEMTNQSGLAWEAGPTTVVWLYGTNMTEDQLASVAPKIVINA